MVLKGCFERGYDGFLKRFKIKGVDRGRRGERGSKGVSKGVFARGSSEEGFEGGCLDGRF